METYWQISFDSRRAARRLQMSITSVRMNEWIIFILKKTVQFMVLMLRIPQFLRTNQSDLRRAEKEMQRSEISEQNFNSCFKCCLINTNG
jgi:hypothetical protein